MSPDYFDDNLRIDLEGTINVCRAVAPHMATAGTGHIVNIASVAGYLGIYGYTGYSAAKFAVMGFSEALRFEMKPLGVAVSVVCPPDTETPGLELERSARPAETEAIAGSIAALNPSHVARKIVKGIDSKRFYIIIGSSSKFYFRLKGLLPEIFFAIVDAQVRGVSRKAKENGHKQSLALHDIASPSACLPEQNALNRGGYSKCN
jgi:short-subunit dehydrogenase